VGQPYPDQITSCFGPILNRCKPSQWHSSRLSRLPNSKSFLKKIFFFSN